MELIDLYEPNARSYYGGAIGFIGFDSSVNDAIMIRTILSRNNTLTYGRIWDLWPIASLKMSYREINNKLGALKKAMRSVYFIDQKMYFLVKPYL